MSAFRIALNAARIGYRETRAQYSWRTWLFGWIVRMISQTLFFTAMGLLVGSEDLIEYAFIGNVTAGVMLMVLGIGPDTAWERSQGTLPLLVAAPRSMLPVFAGRNVFHVAQGVAEGIFIFFLVGPWIGVSGNLAWAPLGFLLVAIGSYGLGVFLAAMAIRRPRWGNTMYNIVFWTIIAIGGVNVARSVFPGWVQQLGNFLPLVHGLAALRSLIADGVNAVALSEAWREMAVGAGWFFLALVGFWAVAEGGRKDGSIDLIE